jgi:hypothetical protein
MVPVLLLPCGTELRVVRFGAVLSFRFKQLRDRGGLKDVPAENVRQRKRPSPHQDKLDATAV